MLRSFRLFLAIAVVAGGVSAVTVAAAQSSPPESTAAKKTLRDKAREKRNVLEEKAAQQQKQIDATEKRHFQAIEAKARKKKACRKQASQQKLHLLKRQRFIKKCMAS